MKGGVGQERRGRHGADGEGGVGGTDKGRENRLTKVRYEAEEVKKKEKKSTPKLIFKFQKQRNLNGVKVEESRAGGESGVRCQSWKNQST